MQRGGGGDMLGSLRSRCVRVLVDAPVVAVVDRLCSDESSTALKAGVLDELRKFDLLDRCAWLGRLLASDANLSSLDMSKTHLTDGVLRSVAMQGVSRSALPRRLTLLPGCAVHSLKVAHSPSSIGSKTWKVCRVLRAAGSRFSSKRRLWARACP